ncbi:hypothetical protein EDD66_103127 [Mobilisporobacter senegalensis]|uniref:HNH endonuclease n=1 Tax=Mobilisporobacter senegalensis TaxID=1329262 RepID=A0A3N1XVI3_9FIRM|nr:hypothetical protein EDD66_103127 [Mobilisporobacter senegalensis]
MQSNRDDFPQKIKDLLAKRAGFRCSNPTCRHNIIGANSNPQKLTNIEVASHISAEAQGGPRYNPNIVQMNVRQLTKPYGFVKRVLY